MSLERKEIFEFGDFRLDVDEHAIERIDGKRNGTLTEKAFRALVILVRRRGHLVSKDELIRHVWPDTIVEDNNLEKCIHHIRHFLGETSEGAPYIETVRKHGYRFVGRVKVVEVSGTWLPETFRVPHEDKHREKGHGDHEKTNGSLLTVEPVTDDEKPGARLLFLSKVFIACAAVGVLAIAVLLGYLGLVKRGPAGRPHSIVVLPAMPTDTADRNVLYEIGIADSLINRLSSVENFTIRPLNSVRGYADDPKDPISIGREQKVDYVLASYYKVTDGKITVTAQLYNVASGKVDDGFERQEDIAKVFGAQDAIAAEFANKLIERFNVSTVRPTKAHGTDNPEAYGLYQQAMYLIDKRRPENSEKALGYLDQAVRLDADYADAWAGKALAVRTSGRRDDIQIHQTAIEAIEKALAIDPNLSDAYSASCLEKLLYDYDFVEAEADCKHAINLDPNSSTAHRVYSWVLSFQGKPDGALAQITTAIDLEPNSYINKRDHGNALYIARHYNDAAAEWRRLVELDPTDPVVFNQLIRTLEEQGKEAEAFEWFIKLLNVKKRDDRDIARYQAAYQNSGWRGVLLERATDPNRGFGYETDFHIACLYAQAGEKDKAFEHLEKSFQQNEWAIPQLQVHPQLDKIRAEPRFADLIRRVGLPTN